LIAQTIARLDDHSVDLKRVPPKSRPAASSSIKEAARKDPAVHVSLSSDSLVKEPRTSRSHCHEESTPQQNRGVLEACTADHDRRLYHRVSVRGASEARHRAETAARREGGYMLAKTEMSTPLKAVFPSFYSAVSGVHARRCTVRK
jgi:hypothetical protein